MFSSIKITGLLNLVIVIWREMKEIDKVEIIWYNYLGICHNEVDPIKTSK